MRLMRQVVQLAGIVLALSATAMHATAQARTGDERRVKAVFLYKFAPYVSWPAKSLPPDRFVIGATNEEKTRDVAAAIAGRLLEGRSVAVRHVREGDNTEDLKMLFIGAPQASWLAPLSARTRGRPLLIVSEVAGGLDRGAVINFLIIEGRVRFEVSLPAAESRRLVISSRLLKVAEHVRMEP